MSTSDYFSTPWLDLYTPNKNERWYIQGTVDGSEILQNQLRLVVYPHYLQVFIHPRVFSPDFWTINSIFIQQNFLNHTLRFTFAVKMFAAGGISHR